LSYVLVGGSFEYGGNDGSMISIMPGVLGFDRPGGMDLAAADERDDGGNPILADAAVAALLPTSDAEPDAAAVVCREDCSGRPGGGLGAAAC
jgi:hypothetical protein